jgi:hypothetical protein
MEYLTEMVSCDFENDTITLEVKKDFWDMFKITSGNVLIETSTKDSAIIRKDAIVIQGKGN